MRQVSNVGDAAGAQGGEGHRTVPAPARGGSKTMKSTSVMPTQERTDSILHWRVGDGWPHEWTHSDQKSPACFEAKQLARDRRLAKPAIPRIIDGPPPLPAHTSKGIAKTIINSTRRIVSASRCRA